MGGGGGGDGEEEEEVPGWLPRLPCALYRRLAGRIRDGWDEEEEEVEELNFLHCSLVDVAAHP